METLNHKTIGMVLTVFAIVLIVILSFVKISFDDQSLFLCEAVDSNPDIPMSECPAHKSNVPWLLMFAFGISSVILASGLYLLFSSRRIKNKSILKEEDPKKLEKQSEEVNILELDNEEQQIYKLIKEHKGSMYQSDLVKKTELSKVRMTRLLDKMESMGILERRRRGMANIVVLK